MKKGTVPSIFPWTNIGSAAPSIRAQRYQRRTRRQLDFASTSEELRSSVNNVHDLNNVDNEIVLSMSPVREIFEESHKTTSTQTISGQPSFSIENIRRFPHMVHYYTGLESYDKF